MKLTVVTPVHNRHKTLPRTLEALRGQTLDSGAFEVIVVDDGSEEQNRRAIREIVRAAGFRLIEKAQGGLASARNAGAEAADGRILHFLDDDVVPCPDALEQHLASHAAQDERVAVVGSLPFPPDVELDAFLWYVEHSGHYDLYKHADRKYPGGRVPLPPMNGNSSIARELFIEIGCYDESFLQYGSEDLELGHRLARAGVRFVYNPRAVGWHDHIKNFRQFCRDQETAGESLIRVYRKYPEIKVSKKIDIVEDPLGSLPAERKIAKVVMEASLRYPAIVGPPRWLADRLEPTYALRWLAFPLFRWVGHYHYALGMRRALATRGT